MSCWVVPTIAAELWQIPLEQLWRRIRDGLVPSKQEDGFTFVDVAPDGPKLASPMLPAHLRPTTFTVQNNPSPGLSNEEAAALAKPANDDDELLGEDTTQSEVLGDWRAARKKTARLRIPPRKFAST